MLAPLVPRSACKVGGGEEDIRIFYMSDSCTNTSEVLAIVPYKIVQHTCRLNDYYLFTTAGTALNNLHTKLLPRQIQKWSPYTLNARCLRLDRPVQSVHLPSTGIIEHLNYLIYSLDGFVLYAVPRAMRFE